MSLNPEVFDQSLSKDVQQFSIDIRDLLGHYADKLSANVMYVIFSFHAAQCMEIITADAKKRVAERENSGDTDEHTRI